LYSVKSFAVEMGYNKVLNHLPGSSLILFLTVIGGIPASVDGILTTALSVFTDVAPLVEPADSSARVSEAL